MLIGLDLSTAFDTVCHSTLTKRLQTEFGMSGTALSWIQSYLQDRTQFVKLGQHRSSETTLEVGVPQGSVLGLLLFAVCCSPVADVIASHGVRADVQDSSDVISAVSEPAHLVAQHWIVVRPSAMRAISTDIICQTIVRHCRNSDMERTATCCVKLRLSLYFQIQT